MKNRRWSTDAFLYDNPLSSAAWVEDFQLEGEAEISFPDGRMRIRNTMDEAMGQAANIVYWCPEEFPANIRITWDFWPLKEKGLCVFFFGAKGRNGEDIFDPSLAKRTGEYQMYHSGDINALHVSYYRRMYESERAFHVANLRKSHGFHLTAQGADPIPYPADAKPPYHLQIDKYDHVVEFFINDLPIFRFEDDGKTYGPVIGGGKIGFRQMAPMIGEYANLRIWSMKKD